MNIVFKARVVISSISYFYWKKTFPGGYIRLQLIIHHHQRRRRRIEWDALRCRAITKMK